jgi:hypothetical protein
VAFDFGAIFHLFGFCFHLFVYVLGLFFPCWGYRVRVVCSSSSFFVMGRFPLFLVLGGGCFDTTALVVVVSG